MADIKTNKVPRFYFRWKMRALAPNIRKEIDSTLFFLDKSEIDHFRYGHVTGHRVYHIVLKDGTIFEWNTVRDYSSRNL
ncbi:MAG: hypothetical protein IKN74_01520 [Clostridia bacterium]|nr:hypothetical protein [Clostridia bacterium]